jgi:hypothetical protein
LLISKPVFPVICDLDGHLISARTEKELEDHASNWKGDKYETCTLIDCTGADWFFNPGVPALSPLSGKNRWRKKDIIELFNNSSLAHEMRMSYSTKSLSAKRLDRIINDIVKLINTANQQNL